MKLLKRLKKKKSSRPNTRPHTRFGPVYDERINKLREKCSGYFGYIYALPTGEVTKDGKKLWVEVDYKTLEVRNPNIHYLLIYGNGKNWREYLPVVGSNIFIPYKGEHYENSII